MARLLLALLILLGSAPAPASGLEQRLNIAISLFPRIVAVDEDLERKLDQGRVRIVLVAEGDRRIAYRLSKKLSRKTPTLAGHPLSVELSDAQRLLEGPPPTAVFLAGPLSEGTFQRLSAYLTRHRRLLFSAIPGDVERGAMAGISVTSRVLPYFNLSALKAAGIRIHPRVLAISKRHE